MADLHKAEAAAREALARVEHERRSTDDDAYFVACAKAAEKLDDLLAALDAAQAPPAAANPRGFLGSSFSEAPPAAAVPWAWGMPESRSIVGKHPLMMVRLEIPPNDQYGGALWVPLFPDPMTAVALKEAERKALEGAMHNAKHDAGDVEDACPSIDRDEDAYWAWNKYHGLRKLLATQAPPAAAVSAVARDAARYRWLRNESWAGYNTSKRRPQIAETIAFVDGVAGGVKTILAEDALDAAIDRAMLADNKENPND